MFFWPHLRLLCPCVFKQSGWACRHLTARETLHAFDTPLALDNILLDKSHERQIRSLLPRSITPLVVALVFRALWNTLGGGRKTADAEQPRLTMHKTWETESSIGDLAWKLRWKGNNTKTGVMELNEQGEGDVGVEDETAVQLNK